MRRRRRRASQTFDGAEGGYGVERKEVVEDEVGAGQEVVSRRVGCGSGVFVHVW